MLSGRKVICAKPRSFMNLSGGPIKALAQYFHLAPADIVVVHDELEFDFGTVKLRQGGGDHGHNGLRSTTKSLGTKDYRHRKAARPDGSGIVCAQAMVQARKGGNPYPLR